MNIIKIACAKGLTAVIFLFSLLGSVEYTSPMIMIKSQSVNELKAKVDAGESLSESEQEDYDGYSNYENFYNGAEETTKEAFQNVQDYADAERAFTTVISGYLQDSYQLRLSQAYHDALDTLNASGITVLGEPNEGMIRSNFQDQGDPFANANIAAIASAYAVYDDTYSTCTLKKMDDKFKSPHVQNGFLKATYYWDSVNNEASSAGDGVANAEKTIIPTDIYSYTETKVDLSAADMLTYLGNLPEGDPLIYSIAVQTIDKALTEKNADKTSLESDVATYNSELAAFNAQQELESGQNKKNSGKNGGSSGSKNGGGSSSGGSGNSGGKNGGSSGNGQNGNSGSGSKSGGSSGSGGKDGNSSSGSSATFSSTIDITTVNNNLATVTAEIDALTTLKTNLSNGTKVATTSDIQTSYMEETYKDVVVYTMDLEEDGSPVIDHKVKKEEGQEEDIYVEFSNYYQKIKRDIVKPEIKYDSYATVELTPFSCDVRPMLDLFGLDPDGAYTPSRKVSENIGKKILAYATKTIGGIKSVASSIKSFFTGEEETEEALNGKLEEALVVTNEEAYWNYYRTLSAQTSMATYTSDSRITSAHACSLTAEEIQNYLNNASACCPGLSANRLQFIKTAISMTGAIPYLWDSDAKFNRGKPTGPGWNDCWWTLTGDEKHPYVGLDCSGFVSWVRWTAFDIATSWGTSNFSSECSVISESQLKPGDLGVIFIGGSGGSRGTNHIGIYIGKDAEGNKLWCHCSGSANTVVINNFSGFHYYLRLPETDILEGSDKWSDETISYGFTVADSDAMYTIVKCLNAEYGRNDVGFTAVAEATANHVGGGNGRPTSESAMLGAAMEDGYLVARKDKSTGQYVSQYKAIFILKEKDVGEPTETRYQIVERAIQGMRYYILDDNISHWASSGSMDYVNKNHTFYKQIPEGDGNIFYYW